MKANSHIKIVNILDLIQLHFESIDLTKIGLHGSIFASHPPVVAEELAADGSTLTPIDRDNNCNHKLQKSQLTRQYRSIDWRWQSRLLKWFNRSHLLSLS